MLGKLLTGNECEIIYYNVIKLFSQALPACDLEAIVGTNSAYISATWQLTYFGFSLKDALFFNYVSFVFSTNLKLH